MRNAGLALVLLALLASGPGQAHGVHETPGPRILPPTKTGSSWLKIWPSAIAALRTRIEEQDGFRILEAGTYVEDFEYVAGHGNLDACNGRDGVTAECPSGTYHYVITARFPFVPRCFSGTPHASFRQGPPPGR